MCVKGIKNATNNKWCYGWSIQHSTKKNTDGIDKNKDTDQIIATMLHKYRNACIPYKGIHANESILKTPDKVHNHMYSSSTRLISNVEK